MNRNASVKKENTIRKLRISLSVVVPAFCLFVAYHYYNKVNTPATLATTSTSVQPAESKAVTTSAPLTTSGEKKSEATLLTANKTTSAEKKALVENVPAVSATTTEVKTVAAEDESAFATRPVTSLKDKSATKTNTPDKITVLKYVIPVDKSVTTEPNVSEQVAVSDRVQDPAVAVNTESSAEKAVFVPNAFTPNGDGLNDLFLPTASEEPREYKLSIFDRNGNLVFYTDNFKTGWDGKVTRGGAETVREDVYMWRIELKNVKGEKEHLMGSLTLLK